MEEHAFQYQIMPFHVHVLKDFKVICVKKNQRKMKKTMVKKVVSIRLLLATGHRPGQL